MSVKGRGGEKSVQLVAAFSQSGLFLLDPSQIPLWLSRTAALSPRVQTNVSVRTAVESVWAAHTLKNKSKRSVQPTFHLLTMLYQDTSDVREPHEKLLVPHQTFLLSQSRSGAWSRITVLRQLKWQKWVLYSPSLGQLMFSLAAAPAMQLLTAPLRLFYQNPRPTYSWNETSVGSVWPAASNHASVLRALMSSRPMHSS